MPTRRGPSGRITAGEIAERDLKASERRDKKKISEAHEEEIIVPATPEQLPPASTAPARLATDGDGDGEGRGKRKRKVTQAYRSAQGRATVA